MTRFTKDLLIGVLLTCMALALTITAQAANVVPTDVQMPGSQPEDGVNTLKSNRCGNCHGDYDPAAEPTHNWAGSMMGHAGRDPLFWATVAIAEQDFDGAGDLCIRCHMPGGWLAGRSTPTDGSQLTETDAESAVECDLCHRLTNPDNSEHLGVQNEPFIAQSGDPAEAHYGGGQYTIFNGNDKLGPYADAEARHADQKSNYHRSAKLCGTCHDVSNPVVGDLAPNNGAQVPLAPGTFNGGLGGDVSTKAAFNNPPHKYGVVERTFSEHQASWFGDEANVVADITTLPAELQAGSIQLAFDAASAGGNNGNYEDGDPRSYTCQTCHMRPANGAQGCNKNPRPRPDMPVHDLTGGNYWVPEVIQYMDDQGTLFLGGGLSIATRLAMDDGIARARDNLNNSASLNVTGNTLRVVNLTGHKLISGYPEGRRMWLNIKWYSDQDVLLRNDGEYGTLSVDIGGTPTNIETILDLDAANTRIYEAHAAITQDWADKLITVSGDYTSLPVAFDRVTGAITATIGSVKQQAPGTSHESFHFALNNLIIKDNRIPPYGMKRDLATERNILPVPADQYGNPGATGSYNYYDELILSPPTGATYATIDLLYQPTSWEYIQFLYLANTGQVAALGSEGQNILDAWLNTGMAAPHIMASASWGTPPVCNPTEPGMELSCDDSLDNDCDGLVDSADPDCQILACGDISDKGTCNNEPNCSWQGNPNNGTCVDDVACTPTPGEETNEFTCDDSVDNDCDGLIDAADPDCGAAVTCSDIPDKTSCNAQASCRWDNKSKVCIDN